MGRMTGMAVNFKDYAYYYDLFYQDKDYKGEAVAVADTLKKFHINGTSLLNFGCGTGRHDRELAKLGYHILGIDLSKDMIEIARENACDLLEKKVLSYDVGDIRKYEPKEKHDAVISLFQVMSYQISNADILGTFRSARAALNVGGGISV